MACLRRGALAIVFASLLGCSGLQSVAPGLSVDAPEALEVSTTQTTTADQTTADGASVEAQTVEQVVTNNESGIPVHWFLIGGLMMGLILPQPRFIKWFF